MRSLASRSPTTSGGPWTGEWASGSPPCVSARRFSSACCPPSTYRGWRACGSSKQGAGAALNGVGKRRLTTVLLTVELALTLVLLAGAGLMVRSFLAVYRADSIVDAARVLTMPISLSNAKYRHARAAHGRLPAAGRANRRDSRRLFDGVRHCRPLLRWTVPADVRGRTATRAWRITADRLVRGDSRPLL